MSVRQRLHTNISYQISKKKSSFYFMLDVVAVEAIVSQISIGGHPQFKSALPQLRNIADNQIDCGVAD
jgi:hypothetical protein